jgi:hypothetical protein
VENSWILSQDGNRIGLITKSDTGISVVGRLDKKQFGDIAELESHIGSKISIEQTVQTAEKEAGDINGFPIKHEVFYNLENDPVPSYTRIERSSTRYAAGYYGLKFPHGWTASFCPKFATLADYEYMGPFKSKMEMQHHIGMKNRTIDI